MEMFSFFTPWKRLKADGFLFSGGTVGTEGMTTIFEGSIATFTDEMSQGSF